jgi:hypothetical protein
MHLTVIERAFQLARTGDFNGGKEIDRVLKREGYTHAEIASLTFRTVRQDLLRACRQAQADRLHA